MKRVAITGTVGVGKSAVLKLFAQAQIPTCSADQIVHELYRQQIFQQKMVEHFGEEILVHGEVDRHAIARFVFQDEQERRWLENIMWKEVEGSLCSWCEKQEHSSPSPTVVVVEVPLLFEAGMEDLFDQIIVIVADDNVRDLRLRKRGQADWRVREQFQLPQSEKVKRADIVIENGGSYEELERQFTSVLKAVK